MAAFDFPASPTLGQVYNGYVWDGEKWLLPPGYTSGVDPAPVSASLVANVALNNVANFYDGPSVSLGPGTWIVIATVSLSDTAGGARFDAKLSDGVTLMASASNTTNAASQICAITIAGLITNPVANVRVSARDVTSVNGLMQAALAGPIVGCNITAYRVVGGVAQSNFKKNYIINGAMQVSQENGLTAGAAIPYWPVDCFSINAGGSPGLGAAQVASVTPAGSSNRLRVVVTTADTSIAATDIVWVESNLEGLRVADLMFGTASAKAITLRFGVKAPAGTYCLVVTNSATNRTYVSEYVISAGEANTDVVKSFTVPGDITGTWLKDNGAGIKLRWGLMAGTTFQQAAGAWGTTNAVGSPNQFNFMGSTSNVFELFDVGLYEGTTAPAFTVPDFADELVKCKRYWQSSYDHGVTPGATWVSGTDGFKYSHPTAVFAASWSILPMRADPTLVFYDHAGAANRISCYNGTTFVAGQTGYTTIARQNMLELQHGIGSMTYTNFGWKADARL